MRQYRPADLASQLKATASTIQPQVSQDFTGITIQQPGGNRVKIPIQATQVDSRIIQNR